MLGGGLSSWGGSIDTESQISHTTDKGSEKAGPGHCCCLSSTWGTPYPGVVTKYKTWVQLTVASHSCKNYPVECSDVVQNLALQSPRSDSHIWPTFARAIPCPLHGQGLYLGSAPWLLSFGLCCRWVSPQPYLLDWR